MQYEIVFESDRWCSCYTYLPQAAPAAQSVPQEPIYYSSTRMAWANLLKKYDQFWLLQEYLTRYFIEK